MSFARYAVLVLALVVLGLVTVWGHLRLLSVGYELNEFRGGRDRLEEESRVLGRRIDALATPSAAAARVRALGIELAPPARGGTSSRARPSRVGTSRVGTLRIDTTRSSPRSGADVAHVADVADAAGAARPWRGAAWRGPAQRGPE